MAETLYMDGNCQHLGYFADEKRIRELLSFSEPPRERNRSLFSQVSTQPSVSVHIRRGDYLQLAGSPVLDVAYYEQAMRIVVEREPNPLWVIFSDDISWCRAHLPFLDGAVFVEGNTAEPWEDLRLMAACKHHIIANSSFSWWGAYLGRDPQGVTVLPDKWFDGVTTSACLLKDGWLTVPSFCRSGTGDSETSQKKNFPKIAWLLNGCGLESLTVTGSPIRFCAVSSRWRASHPEIEQTLVTTSGGEQMLRKMGCGLPVVRLPASLALRKEPFKAFRLWSYFVTACAAHVRAARLPQADVVITVSDYFCDVVPALLMKRRHPGLRWIAWIHHRETDPRSRPGNRLSNEVTWRMQAWSFGQIARRADQAWVLDSEAGDEIAMCLRREGMEFDRIRKMRNGIDLSVIRRAPEAEKSVDAVMIGVRPNKGALDIVPVWKEVQRLRPGTTLRLMGGMVGEDAVAEQIARERLGGVIESFKPEGGWLPPEAFFKKVKEARLLFAPSHEEGWGIAVCEAMACGLPVVAYDLPVYRRVYGDALAAVPEGDHRAFAETLCRVLDRADEFSRLVACGRRCAAKYDWDAVARSDWQAVGALQTDAPA